MKTIILFSLLFFSLKLQAQTTSDTPPRYFAQCMLDIPDNTEFSQLETELRANPYVETARLDLVTRRAFILTKDLPSFSEENFLSWLGSHASSASCLQVGLHGIDQVNPYPFSNCNE